MAVEKIFKNNKDNPLNNSVKAGVQFKESFSFYDNKGLIQKSYHKDKTLAKITVFATKIQYEVKCDRDNNLINPDDKAMKNAAIRLGRIDGLDPYRFVKTSKETLESYLQFLKTGKQLYLKKAQGSL